MEIDLSMLQHQYLERLIHQEISVNGDTDLLGQQILDKLEFEKFKKSFNIDVFCELLKDMKIDDEKP